MGYAFFAFILTFLLFLGMLSMLEIGRRIGNRRLAVDPEGARAGTGTVEGAVFALLGLLVAFTFSGATHRFDERRDLIVEETNDIGTAYLRLDLLPEAARPRLKELFRHYVDTRIEVYRKIRDTAAFQAELARSNALQGEIWRAAVAASESQNAAADATKLLLPALNTMFDITTTRTMANLLHPPFVIYLMLFGVALISALLAGYGMAGGHSRNWLHMVGFALVLAAAVYVTLDLEFPRRGLIRVDDFDQALVDLRSGMR
ncbi:hypothetical protein [Methylomagnum ishizawai]|uniref:bestrophin-like domain n=1 Tax=Methylomagnum ishizawai TaxID=1760988 RepID=UPI001C343A45|nr:hypothetical protein [Methylomagnum ishizawai]BBL75528.1 hypothetical protein MishRS11D_26260 [Methylomagnum ishizawai]